MDAKFRFLGTKVGTTRLIKLYLLTNEKSKEGTIIVFKPNI
jgi:hypothetical protein